MIKFNQQLSTENLKHFGFKKSGEEWSLIVQRDNPMESDYITINPKTGDVFIEMKTGKMLEIVYDLSLARVLIKK